jgi:predicted  nucleic acid-binding Zn-ribbon protein
VRAIEERIINVAEKQNYYDSRELRAIALEVRKREDRIKQLEEEIMEVKNKHSVLVADVVLDEDRAERIKQLEEENDAMRADLLLWREQEVKP